MKSSSIPKILLTFLLLPLLLFANYDTIIEDQQDPTLFHHVNVLSGTFNYSALDGQVKGPHPLPIHRSYTSAGYLDTKPISDLKKSP